jgi:hypothetical protein
MNHYIVIYKDSIDEYQEYFEFETYADDRRAAISKFLYKHGRKYKMLIEVMDVDDNGDILPTASSLARKLAKIKII